MSFQLRNSSCQAACGDASFTLSDDKTPEIQAEGAITEEFSSQLQGLRHQALCDLALWSHPAWIQPRPHSIYTTAAMQWVAYHRTWTAAHRVTVAEIIGGVKGVIPRSRLGAYGDFKYDVDFEDLYVDDEDNGDECQRAKPSVNPDSCASDPQLYLGASADEVCCINQLYNTFTRKSQTPTVHANRALHQWLTRLRSVLVAAKRIATFYGVFHSRTDALLKTCLKFVADALRDSEVPELVEKHVAFFVAYEDLLREQVHKIELQSIPQPGETGGAPYEDGTWLWLRLASMEVRRLWPENTRAVFPHEPEHHFLNEQYPLIWINFLRRRRLDRTDHADIQEVAQVPKEAEAGLLSESLLDALTGDNGEDLMSKTMGGPGGDSVSRFPQAHGEWTKSLFPRRQAVGQPDKGQQPAKSVSSAGEVSTISKGIPVAGSPLKFCKVTPTPRCVASPPGPAYGYCQARQVLPGIPRNAMLGCSPQKQQFIVPRYPTGYIRFPMCPSVVLPSPSYGNALTQRRDLQMLIPNHQQAPWLSSPKSESNQNFPDTETTDTESDDLISEIPLPPSQEQSESSKAKSQEDQEAKRDELKSDLTSTIQSKKPPSREGSNRQPKMAMAPILHQSAQPPNRLRMLAPLMHGVLGAQNDQGHHKHFRLGVSHYLESNFLRCRMMGLPRYLATAGRETYPPPLPDVPGTDCRDKVAKWLESNGEFFKVIPEEDIAEDPFFGGNFQPPKAPRRKKADGRLALPCHSLAWLKRGRGRMEDKIEFFKRLFAESRLEELSSKSEPEVPVSRRRPCLKRSSSARDRKLNMTPLGIYKGRKADDVHQGCLPRISSDCLSYKTVAVENREFNAFPAKRVKQDGGFHERLVRDISPTKDMDEAIANLDRCTALVHEALFTEEGQFSGRSRTSGWESFELAVKTVLENLTILVRNRHAVESQYRSIKV